MDADDHNGHGAGSAGRAGAKFPGSTLDAQRTINVDQTSAEADQSLADADGMAALVADETADQLIERADAAMLKVKARHHTRA